MARRLGRGRWGNLREAGVPEGGGDGVGVGADAAEPRGPASGSAGGLRRRQARNTRGRRGRAFPPQPIVRFEGLAGGLGFGQVDVRLLEEARRLLRVPAEALADGGDDDRAERASRGALPLEGHRGQGAARTTSRSGYTATTRCARPSRPRPPPRPTAPYRLGLLDLPSAEGLHAGASMDTPVRDDRPSSSGSAVHGVLHQHRRHGRCGRADSLEERAALRDIQSRGVLVSVHSWLVDRPR